MHLNNLIQPHENLWKHKTNYFGYGFTLHLIQYKREAAAKKGGTLLHYGSVRASTASHRTHSAALLSTAESVREWQKCSERHLVWWNTYHHQRGFAFPLLMQLFLPEWPIQRVFGNRRQAGTSGKKNGTNPVCALKVNSSLCPLERVYAM